MNDADEADADGATGDPRAFTPADREHARRRVLEVALHVAAWERKFGRAPVELVKTLTFYEMVAAGE